MSTQRVSTSLKYALWAAYDFRCFYHGAPVRWDELQIDHVIPEYLAGRPDELAVLLRQLGLPSDWSLTAIHNLVPACDACNTRKLAMVPTANQLILWLTQVAAKVPRVEVERARFKEMRRFDRAKAQLEFALASGFISEAEANRMLATAVAGEDFIRLTAGIELFEGIPVDQLRPSNTEELLDKPVKLGADLPEGLALSNEDGSIVLVRTVREYRDAIEAGYFAATGFAMKMEAFFLTASGALKALAASRPSSRSFVRTPRAGLCDLDLLPSSLLIRFGEEMEDETALLTAYHTIGELVDADAARVAHVTSSAVSIEFGSIRTSMREILRADLDGDGSEDLLVGRYLSAVGGSLGLGFEPIALARLSFSEPFSLTEMVTAVEPE